MLRQDTRSRYIYSIPDLPSQACTRQIIAVAPMDRKQEQIFAPRFITSSAFQPDLTPVDFLRPTFSPTLRPHEHLRTLYSTFPPKAVTVKPNTAHTLATHLLVKGNAEKGRGSKVKENRRTGSMFGV